MSELSYIERINEEMFANYNQRGISKLYRQILENDMIDQILERHCPR